MDRVFDALITAAAADVARHRFAYLLMGGFWIFREKGCCLHDLAGLAIAALRNVDLTPGLLHRMITGGMETFDGRDFPADHVTNRRNAGPYSLLVDDNGAGAAEGLATSEFGACHPDFVANKPEQREIRVAIPASLFAVNLYLDHDRSSLFISC